MAACKGPWNAFDVRKYFYSKQLARGGASGPTGERGVHAMIHGKGYAIMRRRVAKTNRCRFVRVVGRIVLSYLLCFVV